MKLHALLWMTIGLLTFTFGCGGSQPADNPDAHSHAGHDHGEHAGGHSHDNAPHDGTIVDWGGGDFHVEFVVDHDKQEATVYILDDNAKGAAPIVAEEVQLAIKEPVTQIALKAAPQEGDPEGSSSRFVGTHENIGIVREFSGTISGVVDGTPYSGDFAEQPHTH